jgi:hypothetical protein
MVLPVTADASASKNVATDTQTLRLITRIILAPRHIFFNQNCNKLAVKKQEKNGENWLICEKERNKE